MPLPAPVQLSSTETGTSEAGEGEEPGSATAVESIRGEATDADADTLAPRPGSEGELLYDLCRSALYAFDSKEGWSRVSGAPRFDNGPVYLRLYNARALADYRVVVGAREIEDNGPQIRGLPPKEEETGEPEVAEPEPEDVVTLSGSASDGIADVGATMLDLLARLSEVGGVATVAHEVIRERELLERGLDSLEAQDEAIGRVLAALQDSAENHRSVFATLRTRTDSLRSLTSAETGKTRVGVSQFVGLLSHAAEVDRQLGNTRDSIAASGIWTSLKDQATAARRLQARVRDYSDKLGRLDTAVKLYNRTSAGLLAAAIDLEEAGGDPAQAGLFDRASEMELRTRMRSLFTGLDTVLVRRLRIDSVLAFRDEYALARIDSIAGSYADTALARADTLAGRVRTERARVQAVFDEINALYPNVFSDRWILLGQWDGNFLLSVTVEERGGFTPLYVDRAATPQAPAGQVSGVEEVSQPAEPNPTSSEDEASAEPAAEDTSEENEGDSAESGVPSTSQVLSAPARSVGFQFEVEKRYRFTAFVGFARSWVPNNQWLVVPTEVVSETETITTTDPDTGEEVTEDVVTTTQYGRAEALDPSRTNLFWLGAKTYVYPGARTSFPGGDGGLSVSLLVGVGLAAGSVDWLVGVGLEGWTGVDVVAGFHFGSEATLRSNDDFVLNNGTESTIPTVSVGTRRPFVGLTFDADVFKAIFGKAVADQGRIPTR